MSRKDNPATLFPPWVRNLGAPVWVTDSEQRISYFNEKAEVLFARKARKSVGRPCHGVIGGIDASGHPLCRANCEVLQWAREGREIAPCEMHIPRRTGGHWIQVLYIAVETPAGTSLVHCALMADRAHRLEKYFRTVQSRSVVSSGSEVRDHSSWTALTRRESEILQHLADGENLHEVAIRLCVSYVTVRNHVQHILAKLGVHSIAEAVACHLLGANPDPQRDTQHI